MQATMYTTVSLIERRISEMTSEQKDSLLVELEKLHQRQMLAETVGPDYYEPGMMEYLDQSDGKYDEASKTVCICCQKMMPRRQDSPCACCFLSQ